VADSSTPRAASWACPPSGAVNTTGVVEDGDGVLPVRGQRPVGGGHRPVVTELAVAEVPKVIIGSIASAMPGTRGAPRPGRPMFCTCGPCASGTDAVPAVAGDDAVVARSVHGRLDGVRYVGQPPVDAGRDQAVPQRLLARGRQRRRPPPKHRHRHGDRGVAVPAVDDGAEVRKSGHPRAAPCRATDAVHDLGVDRGADHRRERRETVVENDDVAPSTASTSRRWHRGPRSRLRARQRRAWRPGRGRPPARSRMSLI